VNKRTRLVPGEGLFQAGNSFDLAIAHAVRVQRRRRAKPRSQRRSFGKVLRESFRAME
jgi:hypothetical protein